MEHQKKKYDIVTAMDICVDILVRLGDVIPQFAQKEHMIDDLSIEMGGSCSIFACQAAKLGLNVAGIGKVGNDLLGSLVIESMSKSGVDTHHIKIDETIKTGASVILCKNDGDRCMLTYSGSIDEASVDQFTPEIFNETKHLHIGSYYLTKKIKPYYPLIIEKLKKQNATISLDTNWDPEEIWSDGLWDVLTQTDIFLPNENEIKAISGKKTVESSVDALLDYVPIIAVKMGENGACLYTKKAEWHEPALKVVAVDTVGAGDSFDAGVVYGMLSGYDLQKCLKAGIICGSLNTRKAGGIAGQPLLDEFLKIFREDQ